MRNLEEKTRQNKLDSLTGQFGSVHKNAVFYGSLFFKASQKVTSSANQKKNRHARYFKDGLYLEYIAREEAVSKEDRSKVFDIQGNEISLDLAKQKMAKLDDDQFVWENVLSFDDKTKKLIDFNDKKSIAKLIQRPLYDFWKSNGINPKNIDLVFSIHQNTEHPHIHFSFWEKEKTYKLRTKNGEDRSFRIKGALKKETFLKLKQDIFIRILEIQNEKKLYTSEFVEIFKNKLENGVVSFENKDYADAYNWVKENKSTKEIRFKNLTEQEQEIILKGVRSVFKTDPELAKMLDEYYKQAKIINSWIQEQIKEFNENHRIATYNDIDDPEDKSSLNYHDLTYDKLSADFLTKELNAKFGNAFIKASHNPGSDLKKAGMKNESSDIDNNFHNGFIDGGHMDDGISDAFIKSLHFKAKKSESVWYRKTLDNKTRSLFENSSYDVDFDKSKKFKRINYKTRNMMHNFFKDSFDKSSYMNAWFFECSQRKVVEHLKLLNQDKLVYMKKGYRTIS
ncbi:hypothetical protein LNO75_00380 [Mycoplasma sp. T363T]|uniref:relaxase MobL n=1 Tax=Mycoplasma bradburyae TaxID=2963128 RepID=UPI0023425182|nr:hypothetical protein [Mycoplasma bradburyae]MDC4163037.1 hypothetical protein [Mycoplasma bradburyae]